MDKELAEEMKWYQSLGALDQATYDEIHKAGLPSDYFNEWSAFPFLGKDNLAALQPIPTFEEYVKAKTWSQEFKDFVLKRSSPEKVRQVDALAAEFNRVFGTIQAEQDTNALQDFYRRAMSIQKSEGK